MIVAMADDPRVIPIKLADRLHNMRTIEHLPKQKQVQTSKETLEVYAPLAHRLGIHAIKWELEDLAFETLHPRKYEEIKTLVASGAQPRRARRGGALRSRLEKVDIPANISARAKHFYSIYEKMTKKGREFNEIYDLTAMRVIVELGRGRDARLLRRARADPFALEADAGSVQGLHRDAEVQRLPVAAHDRDRARGEAARDPDPHAPDARDGRAGNRRALGVQARRAGRRPVARLGEAADGLAGRRGGSAQFMRNFRTDLFDDEVFVFTPRAR